MIIEKESCFLLQCKHSTLLLYLSPTGKITTEYYGGRLKDDADPRPFLRRYPVPLGRSIIYDETKSKTISLPYLSSDYSTPFKGDVLHPSLILESDAMRVFDFVYESHQIVAPMAMEGYPTPRGGKEELVIVTRDPVTKIKLELHYVVYEEHDVIGRYAKLVNDGDEVVHLRKIASMQLVLDKKDCEFVTFHGSWAAEFQKEITPIGKTYQSVGSLTGSSNDNHNPFFMVKKKETTNRFGEAYGFNLIYSGNHLEEVECSSFEKIRITTGINPLGFDAKIEKGESFLTPMAVMTYSNEGLNGIAHHMHSFVNSCVLPEAWATRPRPIAFNSWEGCGFDFNEGKLHKLAKCAKDLGIELFVLDDGWFGKRDDDTSSLGDWTVNKKKLPHGIDGLSKYVHKLGMKFGLWFEPEMISPDSDLYRAHPDWAIQDGLHNPSLGRNQLVLDLSKEEVRDYLFKALSDIIGPCEVDYIKWDYNRYITDVPCDGLFFHRYILGLYELLDRLVKAFPSLQMENCASGGSRNDLGMFSYFCQGWVSDDTDSYERTKIQTGMAYGYPLSVMSNHVAAKTSQALLRKTSFGTKFDVACFGVFGYEMDIDALTPLEKKEILSQIEIYKKRRELFQFGTYDLLDEDPYIFEVHNEDSAAVSYVNGVAKILNGFACLPVTGLDPDALYHYEVRQETIDIHAFGTLVNMISPIHLKEDGALVNILSHYKGMDGEKMEGTAYGNDLNQGALSLGQEWGASGISDDVRVLRDFGARIYFFDKR